MRRKAFQLKAIWQRAAVPHAAAKVAANGRRDGSRSFAVAAESGRAAEVDAAQIVQRTAARVLGDRIRLVGVQNSGAHEHYRHQLAHGLPIPPYEIKILDLIRTLFPNLSSYHEIGSGIGTLPIMLACAGFAAVGIERDEARHLTALAILRGVARDAPWVENDCRLIGAAFPEGVSDIDVSNSMAITTDIVSTQSPQEYRDVVEGLSRYRYVLMDLQRFCRKRGSAAEFDTLIDELEHLGLPLRAETIDCGQQGYYRLFENARLANPYVAGGGNPAAPAPASIESAIRGKAEPVPAEVKTGEVVSPTATPIVLAPHPQRAKRKRFGGIVGLSALLVIGCPSLAAVVYYGFWASDQFVTNFEFAVAGAPAGGSGKSYMGMSSGAISPGAFVVTDYINSSQAVQDVEKSIDLRTMFSRSDVDFLSRLTLKANDDQLDAFWKSMVSAQFDLVSGTVTVSVRAFAPRDSLALAERIISASDNMFAALGDKAEKDAVKLADDNLARTGRRLTDARQALLAFRDKTGLLEPTKTADTNSVIVGETRKQLADVEAQYDTIRATSPRSPMLSLLRSKVIALQSQIDAMDSAKSSEGVVKRVTPAELDQYERLSVEKQVAEKLYDDALQLQGKAYLAAASEKPYLALFVKPRLADTALYPDRLKSIAIVVVASMAAWLFGLLISLAVKDHLL